MSDLETRVSKLEELMDKVLKGAAPGERKEVTKAMKATAFVLSKHPSCKEDWKKFLTDMQGMASLSPGQAKFWSVIHKECLGTWPEKESLPQPPSPPSVESEDIPF